MTGCSVYVGNLDERVSDRVLYDILIQAGRVVDLHIPRDRETEKPKGYAFVEYETEEVAEYAVKLFSGLVALYNRTLKFAISGQDKSSQNLPNGHMSESNSLNKLRHHSVSGNNVEISHQCLRFSAHPINYSQVPPPPGVANHPNGHSSLLNGINYDNSRRDFGSTFDMSSRPRSRRYDISNSYPSY